jgi:3-phosphoshikimate 1-carboxyvinyltransferase
MQDWRVGRAGAVAGELRVPGDKSISHRALILAAMAEGVTEIRGLLRGEDCLATLRVLQALGAEIEDGDLVRVRGRGAGALREAETVLDAGNSGTTLRLMAGVLAGRPMLSVLTGDDSLRQRPMRRVVEPLRAMGAEILGRCGGDRAPLAIRGGGLRGIAWRSRVASAQVKSSILLAGLQAVGVTEVVEPVVSRDHTERMLDAFGVAVRRGGAAVRVAGPATPRGTAIAVPGDFSSAAFFLVAAAVRPGADLLVREVGVNPTRTGLLDVLRRMGASVSLEAAREAGGEPVADVRVRGGRLAGVRVPAEELPRLIDEVPVLAVAAALAGGETVIEGAGELRVKEVDRLAALAEELTAMGAAIRVDGERLRIAGGCPLHGARVASRGDHRMAMSLAVAGASADGETTIRDTDCVETSFPGFGALFAGVVRGSGLEPIERRE